MATRSRVSAIRGYRATGGDYWSQPTPFQGGDVSGPAIFAKIGHGLIARRRAQSAMAQLERQSALQEELTRAQIANLNSLATSRGQADQTYDLTIPGQDQGATIGPPQPEVIRGLKPNEYATQRRLYYPEPGQAPQVNPETARHNLVMEGQRERALGISQQRADAAGKATRAYTAAQAELGNITAEEKRREGDIESKVGARAAVYRLRAGQDQPDAIRKQALSWLGADPETDLKDADYQKYVDGFAKEYVRRHKEEAMVLVRRSNLGRRSQAEAVTKQAAGILQAQNADQQLLEQFKSIIEAPDEEQP